MSVAVFPLALLLAGGCASAPAVAPFGTTNASPALEADTAKVLLAVDEVADPACRQRWIESHEIAEMRDTSAREHWILARCGARVRYSVTYSKSRDGGTDIQYDTEAEILTNSRPAESALLVPRTFDTVWFRPGKRESSVIAYSSSDTLVVDTDKLVFGDGNDSLEILLADIQQLNWGMLPPDDFNFWVVVAYGSPVKTVGFKDGRYLGNGNGTGEIYATIRTALQRSQSVKVPSAAAP